MAHPYDVDFVEVGKRLRECRLDRHLTQEQLAELVDISSSFVGHIERAEKLPSINTIAKLSRCLGISQDYLTYGTVTFCDKQHCSLYENLRKLVDSHSSQPHCQHTNL